MRKAVDNWTFPLDANRFIRYFAILCGLAFSLAGHSATLDVVRDFQAVGDAVQLWVNTTSNSVVVTTTNQFSSADIGKAIQVFDAGKITTAPECQDMVTTITNVFNGTNIYVSQIAQRTLTNTFATYGHDNRTNFQNAVNAAHGTNTVIHIPSGNYLILSEYYPSLYGNAGIILRKGGIQFIGEGTNETVLLSQGAWLRNANLSGAAWRGFLFAYVPPITNDYPVVFESLTMDGGVPNGLTASHGFPASITTGNGWDETHGAIVIRGGRGTDRVVTQQTLTNVLVQHWRGEMLKSNEQSTNGNLNIFDSTFFDGNATALNYYASLNVSNCVFDALFQIAEYYQAYSTNKSYFQNNFATNIQGNGFVLNGSITNHIIPDFIIRSNTIVLTNNGYIAVAFTPARNVYIIGNTIGAQVNGTGISTIVGYQGSGTCSNVVVEGNVFRNLKMVFNLQTDFPNAIDGLRIVNNTYSRQIEGLPKEDVDFFFVGRGWYSNVLCFSNVYSGSRSFGAGFSGGSALGQYAYDDLSNLHPPYQWTGVNGLTNVVSYYRGARHVLDAKDPNLVFALESAFPMKIPPGAQMLVSNAGPFSLIIYSGSTQSRSPIELDPGKAIQVGWTNGTWQLPYRVSPPGRLKVIGE